MGMMERVRDWFAPSRLRSVAPPSIHADFMRGNRGVVFGGWRPALREASDDVGSSWDMAAARTIDLIQNSGWMAGAIDQAVANTVGTGLRLKAMPENDLFGMSNAEAEGWAQTVEQRWSLWAEKPYECDIEGRRSFGLLQAAAFRSWFATGEIWAEIPWRERPSGRYGTKVRLVPSHRIVRRNDNLRGMVQGVRMDGDGFPVTAHVRAKVSESTVIATLTTANDGLLRISDTVVEIVIPAAATAGLGPGSVVMDMVRTDLEPGLHLNFTLEIPVIRPVTRGLG